MHVLGWIFAVVGGITLALLAFGFWLEAAGHVTPRHANPNTPRNTALTEAQQQEYEASVERLRELEQAAARRLGEVRRGRT